MVAGLLCRERETAFAGSPCPYHLVSSIDVLRARDVNIRGASNYIAYEDVRPLQPVSRDFPCQYTFVRAPTIQELCSVLYKSSALVRVVHRKTGSAGS